MCERVKLAFDGSALLGRRDPPSPGGEYGPPRALVGQCCLDRQIDTSSDLFTQHAAR